MIPEEHEGKEETHQHRTSGREEGERVVAEVGDEDECENEHYDEWAHVEAHVGAPQAAHAVRGEEAAGATEESDVSMNVTEAAVGDGAGYEQENVTKSGEAEGEQPREQVHVEESQEAGKSTGEEVGAVVVEVWEEVYAQSSAIWTVLHPT